MWLDPIKGMVDHWLPKFETRLIRVESKLAEIAKNTAAEVAEDQYVKRGYQAGAGKIATVINTSGSGWVVDYVTATVNVKVFSGAITPENFLGEFKAGTHEKVTWYIPNNGSLLFECEAEGGGQLQARILASVPPVVATSGDSGEYADTFQVEEPASNSGHPLTPNAVADGRP